MSGSGHGAALSPGKIPPFSAQCLFPRGTALTRGTAHSHFPSTLDGRGEGNEEGRWDTRESSSVTAVTSPECVQSLTCDHLLVTGPQSAPTWGVCSHINQNHQAETFKTMKVMGIQQLLIHSCFKFRAIDDLRTAAYQLLGAIFLHPRPHPH